MTSQAPDLDAWFAGPLGGILVEQERAMVGEALECAFGLHCVQVGCWGGSDAFLARARTRRASLVAEPPDARGRARSRSPPRSRCSPTAWT